MIGRMTCTREHIGYTKIIIPVHKLHKYTDKYVAYIVVIVA